MTHNQDENPRSFEIQHDTSKEMEQVPATEDTTPASDTKPARKRRPARRRKASQDPDLQPPATPSRLPLPLRPTSLILLGALLMIGAWLGYQNPFSGVHQESTHWPWETFRANFDQGGGVVFRWDAVASIALGGTLLILLLVVGSILRSSPARGAYVFVVAGISALFFWKDAHLVQDTSTIALHAVGAMTAGAVLLRGGGRGGRWVLPALVILLAGLLFFPRAGEAWAGYNPLAFDVLRPLGVFIELPGKDMPSPDVGAGLARIWSVDGLHAIGLGLLTLVGIVTLFGLRGRWTLWTVTLLVLLTALLPILATHVADAPLAEAGTTDLLSLVGTTGWTLLFALTLILLAGLLSLLGVGGPWTVGVAGVGLGTLTLVVASRYYVMGLASNPDAAPFWAGLAGAAIWLGPGLGAMLAPLAAGVVDQGD